MLARLYVMISSHNESDIEQVKNELLTIDSRFSISCHRDCPHLKEGVDFYATININEDEIQLLLNQLNNDWDGDYEECSCYGFNTKMFNSLVYYLDFTLWN